MSEKEMRVFDVSFRRAALAYNRFDDSVRTIASYRQSGSFPSDWGNHVRDVMNFIRLAKVSLTKAINDARMAAEDESLRDDELYELSDSEALLNSRLQRVIAVEESLLNTILSGDADYVSMYLASQQAHQDIEARIRRVAYGNDAPETEPELVDVESDDDTQEEVIDDQVSEETEDDAEEVEDVSEDGAEYPGDADESDDDSENSDEDSDESDDEDGQGHVALVVGDDGVAHMVNVHDAYIMEETTPKTFYEIDDDEESTPDAEEVEGGWQPAPKDSEDVPDNDSGSSEDDVSNPLESMSFTDKARFIMEDADIQRLIHDEADRLARAQYQAMVYEAAAMAPKETRVAAAPESIPISNQEPAHTETVPGSGPVHVDLTPVVQDEPAKKTKGRGRSASSAGTSSRGSGRKKEKAPKEDKPAGRSFRLRRPKDEGGSE